MTVQQTIEGQRIEPPTVEILPVLMVILFLYNLLCSGAPIEIPSTYLK